MNIKVTKGDEKTILALSGRLDATTSPQFQEALMPNLGNNQHVELDLSKLAYISSAGLRVLLMGEKKAAVQGGSQTLVNVSPDVMQVFEMTGFSKVLHFE
ncbi:anti-sigma factor antagonist [Clostridia bacterium]|nr:anti-sigma factor antagonist [Clostridia bacterium]